MALPINSKAPNFVLPSTSGFSLNLDKDLQGQACIIYFYPKDFTPGCTAEACSFRDAFEEFRGVDLPIFGISRDSIDSHLSFKKKYQLPFELLSDKSGKTCKAYKALIPVVNLPKRVTYLLDAEHHIVAAYEDLFGYKKHMHQMIENIKATNN